MAQKILLLTPPFTQLNTPYPATAYLKGFLNTQKVVSHQADLGIEVILKLFSKHGLQNFFDELEKSDFELDENTYRIYALREEYLKTVDAVIQFLQHKNPTLAHSICDRTFLPEAARFQETEDLEWAFGTMGLHDKARHLATLYLEDIGDLISATLDPNFGFSRYAERLGRTASSFDELYFSVLGRDTIVSKILKDVLRDKIEAQQPNLVCISVPFPGNLFGALKCGQFIKQTFPHVKIALGGGFANTELRSLQDPRVFEFLDFVCLDDGEAPLLSVIELLDGKRSVENLKRTFSCNDKEVIYHNGSTDKDVPMKDVGTPDYSDLPLDKYLSVIEVANPMHRLWSDGRWNKLTLAHGCYWGKCSFCDISLDYIKHYEPLTAVLLCDRMQEIIAQTGETGFHFVDEAAPPHLLRDLALEIIRRKMVVSWWTNIRFERAFTPDLARLLKASGCIAVAGGLEVASDRLLEMMKKGVTVAKVAQVADGFTQAGIMVHAYLMYGFPTQNVQETVDSLEMVRQLFESGALQSGFWHRFAMTAHSPIGLAPEKFEVEKIGPEFHGFADNDLYHEDPLGANHDLFAEGLRKSLFNYMHGVGYELALQDWFDFEIPDTTISPHYIQDCLAEGLKINTKQRSLVVWLGQIPDMISLEDGFSQLEFCDKQKDWKLTCNTATAEWLLQVLPTLKISNQPGILFSQLKSSYEMFTKMPFENFTNGNEWQALRENGLLIL